MSTISLMTNLEITPAPLFPIYTKPPKLQCSIPLFISYITQPSLKKQNPFLAKVWYIKMKRSMTELDHSVTMANCLMFLSRGNEYDSLISTSSSSSPSRVFECKTCNRQFPSFQALGGHRASHKKPRLAGGDGSSSDQSQSLSPSKPKTHECNICGLEFAIGQALGGHMRRHRAAVSDSNNHHRKHNGQSNSMMGLSSSNLGQVVVPVLKKTNSSRRVLCLDLNLTPFENDMEILGIGKTTPPLVEFIF